jgi:hypothetical protein
MRFFGDSLNRLLQWRSERRGHKHERGAETAEADRHPHEPKEPRRGNQGGAGGERSMPGTGGG